MQSFNKTSYLTIFRLSHNIKSSLTQRQFSNLSNLTKKQNNYSTINIIRQTHTNIDTKEKEKKSLFHLLKEGKWPKVLSKDYITAPQEFNRWLIVPGSFILQISIGSVYAWSMWNEPLTRSVGVVAAAASDWNLGQVLPVFSASAITLGFCTFFLGTWAEKAGPRMVGVTAATAYGFGCVLSGIGCLTHQLELVYIGYGLFGGIGWGLGYISPVSTLMKWFPDKRGLATGLALTAFGAGAALAAPVIKTFTNFFFSSPIYIGNVNDVHLVIQKGRQFAEISGELKEVVVATASDISKVSDSLSEGVYLIGTGSSGAAGAFMSIGVMYFFTMMYGALSAKVPHPEWRPYKDWKPQNTETKMVTSGYINQIEAIKTPQFYLLWGAVFCNAIAGTALISSAKIIMTDIFGTILPTIVTGTFASSYVASLSLANSAGRFGWAVGSDYIGRKNTYFIFGLAIPICAGIPALTAWATTTSSTIPLVLFSIGTLISFSFYGGIFSVLPAYIADIFGQKHVGAIHGRLLTAWSCAALCGPKLLATFRESSQIEAITDLSKQCNEEVFLKTFGAPISDLPELIKTNTVTINRLIEIVPNGVVDPTPYLYNSTMFACSSVLCVALACNSFMKPINPKLMRFDSIEQEKK